uniref:Uncharacterized protein n=1 Tax=Timema bartmani TaxID=61472 RepID=A0A7R9EVT3_9NEOP|nr:unnamed protein product [Timema bartmani]
MLKNKITPDQYCFKMWTEYLDKNPVNKYISSADKSIVIIIWCFLRRNAMSVENKSAPYYLFGSDANICHLVSDMSQSEFLQLVAAILLAAVVNSSGTNCPPGCSFDNMESNTTIVCSDVNWTRIPENLETSLKVIDFSNNKIEQLTADTFKELKELINSGYDLEGYVNPKNPSNKHASVHGWKISNPASTTVPLASASNFPQCVSYPRNDKTIEMQHHGNGSRNPSPKQKPSQSRVDMSSTLEPLLDNREEYHRRQVYSKTTVPVGVREGFDNQTNLCRDRGLNPGPPAQKSETLPLSRQVTLFIPEYH